MIIDKYNLDVSWEHLAEEYKVVNKAYAEAIWGSEKAKKELKESISNVDKLLRKNPDKYDIDKVTDKSIASAVERHSNIIELNNKVVEANYIKNKMEGEVKTLELQKKALESLQELFFRGYYMEVDKSISKQKIENAKDDKIKKRLRKLKK